MQSVMVCFKEHRKKTLKKLRYYKWNAWYKSLPNSGRKKICACSDHIPYTHHTSFFGARNIMHENVCVTIIKEERIENLQQIFFIILAYISQKANKLVCFVNNEGSFKVRNMVHDFSKNSCEMHVSWCTCCTS